MFISASLVQKQAVVTITKKADPAKEEGILFATDTAKAKKSDSIVHYLRIRLGIEVGRTAGLLPGMRVDLRFDPGTGKGLIVRLPDEDTEGWLLSGLNRNAKGAQPLQLKFTWHKKLPSIAEPKLCTDVSVQDAGIEFRFPIGISFGDLAVKQEDKKEGEPIQIFRRREGDNHTH